MIIGLASWPVQPAEDAGEQRVVAGGDPKPAAGAAPVALPVGRVAALPGQQGGRGSGQREVVDLAERQAARRRVERHGVGRGSAGWTAGRRRRWRAPRPSSVQPVVRVRRSPQ